MIRPVDIQEKEFSKGVRGYKEEEVNVFLDEITIELEQLLNEYRQLKDENRRLSEEIDRLRGTEGTVVETLEAAKSLMSDISASAEKRADILLKNAELDAGIMRKEAEKEAGILYRKNEYLKKSFSVFRDNYRKLLEDELKKFDAAVDIMEKECDAAGRENGTGDPDERPEPGRDADA